MAQAAFEAFRSAGILCQQLNTDDYNLSANENFCNKLATTQIKRCSKEHLAAARKVFSFNAQLYVDAIVNLGRYNLNLIKQQQDRWLTLIEAREYKHIKPYPSVVLSHIEQLAKSKKSNMEEWIKSCVSVKY